MLIGQSLLATQRKLLPVFPAAKDCLSFISQDPASTLKKDSMQSLQIFEIEPREKGHFAVLADEAQRIHALQGQDVTLVRLKTDKRSASTMTVEAGQVLTEAELAAQKGVMYVRFTATDHLWPDAGEIERFRRFVKTLPKDAWLHFHCVAGEGRTTAFMTMYDMLKKPDVPYEDIVLRQLRIGGVYTPFLGKGLSTWKKPYYRAKKRGLEAFYRKLHKTQVTD